MRTRSQTRNRNRQQQAPPAVIESFNLEEPFDNHPLVSMADNRTMAELLQAPTEGYEDAIVIPEINANFELKHDSLNSAAGGNFLDKMPRECLKIIESKSKVRNSRNKALIAKVSSSSSTPRISPDVAALTTEWNVKRGEKDTVFPTNNGITEDVQPPVVPVENQILVSEPVVVPVSVPMPNPKPSDSLSFKAK
ncbi:hypothetical protein Tco_0683028 [Tanacetum coccineum]|uniref:Reverse transcriptase domain-containing protein n=1 Tax=Tanacetum coccineum TaxID=301880 RepID=A0ABQ4XUS5_9ASTR